MIDKLKGFIDIQVPVDTCSLRCHYCYITQKHLFDSKLPKIKYTPEQVGKALARERLGGTYHINMCGNGETLLPPEMTGIVRAILEQGHYIMIVTNGTITRRFEEMAQYPEELRRRLGFKFSFHYLELKKRKLLDAFFANIERVRQAGCSFSLEVTPSDELIPYIDELKEESLKRVGALPHLTVARDETNPDFVLLTEMSREDYIKTWSTFNSPLFDFKIKIFLEKRNEFCYNGLWGGILSLGSGRLRACDNNNIDKDIFADYTSPITLRPVGICNKAHCHNGHSWLTLGMIPSMETPLYASMRDRIDSQGRHWLNDDMRQFLSQKIKDSNTLLSSEEEALIRRPAKMGNLTYNAEAAIKTPSDMSFDAEINRLRSICSQSLLPLIGPKCILADAPYYDNIGDILIWQGIHDFLKDNSRKCLHDYSMWTFDYPALPPDVTILLTGGGNFGDLWRVCQDFRLNIIGNYPDNPVVMFPQSVWYDDKNLLAKDAGAMAQHKNLTLCARDRYTYDIFRTHFSSNNIMLIPDMAFCISENHLSPYRNQSVKGRSLYFKRTDKELCNSTVIFNDQFSDIRDWPSMEHKMARFELFRIARGIRRRLPGRHLRHICGNAIDLIARPAIRTAMLNTGCRFLAPYEHVTTTRLHAMILSILLHKPVSYIDNTTGKLSAFAQTWLSDLDAINPYQK